VTPASGMAGETQEGVRLSAGFLALVVLGIAALTALGIWQLERREWKLALIERVEQRVHAEPIPAPERAVTAAEDEYRHVRLAGHYLDTPATLVQAVTELGSGYWVLAPFRTEDGFTVLLNRGFVPPEEKSAAALLPPAETEVTGLLRLSEPKGGFLRTNDPGQDRWYSRDTAAIGAERGLESVADYFVDVDAGPANWPRGGLTVIAFTNNHLVYALTWFCLALMLAVATIAAGRKPSSPHKRI
jgi:surfeit locus 1 family protein